jgi:thiamine biosynthesis lipoprotein ApbE
MIDRIHARAAVAWTNLRLDELDEILFEAARAVDGLKDDARESGERALERLRRSQETLRKLHCRLRTGVQAGRGVDDEVEDAFEAEWIEVESTLQFLSSVEKDRSEVLRRLVGARAGAQRQAWAASVAHLYNQASEVVEMARGEFDVAIKRLSAEAERFQSRIGAAKDASDQSWQAVKSELVGARAAYDRATEKIEEALAKLL